MADLPDSPIPVAYIDDTGIHAPDFPTVHEAVKGIFRGIYGQDIYLEPDSQDGQFAAILARGFHDCNSMAVSVYNAFSPSTAQGNGLASVVKINGIKKAVATYSSVDLVIIGQAGTEITDGYATDENGNHWNLPAIVVIPPAGEVTVTATAAVLGATRAQKNTITGIGTPTRGWQSVNNPFAAVEGAPVEKDATLRRRQTVSTALPSLTVLDGIVGSVASLDGVTRYKPYENDTNLIDENGIPPHSISLVVEGGDAQAIADSIMAKKTPGSGTYGTTQLTSVDVYGLAHTISFFRPSEVPISVAFTLKAFPGYTETIERAIKQAIADYLNSLDIGEMVYAMRVYVPASLANANRTYEIIPNTLMIARDGGTPAAADLAIAFNEAASCSIDDIAIKVTR